ncbi:MAG: NHLP family bacteriocin export ABC transporter peptidase/permease/ATPase subunit [Opitutales bacterium]|nr:NHLP family bacteriocin export ABC transporter peptidase/permease/ATPase subunit [Opitutales bacterium]MCH8539641.1 NHLP family bacteriocin export ABC transporter peptidase/permease/ATPase subunit [Opitutales bacterium]
MTEPDTSTNQFPPGSGKVRRTPTVLQMEAVECGAAALAIILRWFGYFATLEELRIECGVSRDGSKASKMVKAARRYGLNARGLRREPEDLRKINTPCILFWNFNHFVVLEGLRGNRAYLNDPAIGRRTVSLEELDESFTGVVLEFSKGPEFKKEGSKPSLFKALASRFKHSESALAYLFFAGLFLVIPGLVIPTFSKIFVDEILVQGMHNWIRPLLLAMGVTAAVVLTLNWLQQIYLLRMETKMALSTSGKFFTHLLRLPAEFFTHRSGGELAHRVRLNDEVATIVARDLTKALIDAVVIVFFFLLMLQYDVLLSLAAAGLLLINLVAFRYYSRCRVDSNRQRLLEEGKQTGTAMAGLQMIETLKATGTEGDFFARWAGHQAKTIGAKQRLGGITVRLNSFPTFLNLFATAVILGLGGLRVMEGELTMGSLIAFQILAGSFLAPIERLVGLGLKWQEAEGTMNRLDDVFRYKEDSRFDPPKEQTDDPFATTVKLSGQLEIRDLTFGYSKLDPPLIEGFNLTLKPGERVALVGGSGSGKSTIARLIAGLYYPWKGEVLLDGVPREDIPPGLIANSIGYVDQEIFLFEGTARDNLSLWDATIPEAHLTTAAKDAEIHEDIASRSGGYATLLEESGANFSGGQRQRMEIARALVGNPSLLLLDEATSALDVATEKAIDDHLRRRGCSCLIVAHRLSTVRDCDEIIVMDNGKIVQRGTHDDLIATSGPYRTLMEAY